MAYASRHQQYDVTPHLILTSLFCESCSTSPESQPAPENSHSLAVRQARKNIITIVGSVFKTSTELLRLVHTSPGLSRVGILYILSTRVDVLHYRVLLSASWIVSLETGTSCCLAQLVINDSAYDRAHTRTNIYCRITI